MCHFELEEGKAFNSVQLIELRATLINLFKILIKTIFRITVFFTTCETLWYTNTKQIFFLKI